LVSTAELSRSIADVYVCRKDFFDANRELVTKFVVGYLKGCEEVIDLKKQYEAKGSKDYLQLLQLAQDIFGKSVLADAGGRRARPAVRLHVCRLPRQRRVLHAAGEPARVRGLPQGGAGSALDRGFAKVRCGLFAPASTTRPGVPRPVVQDGGDQAGRSGGGGVGGDRAVEHGRRSGRHTIVSFTIQFKPNQTAFSAELYGAEYQRVVEMADKFGNAVVVVRATRTRPRRWSNWSRPAWRRAFCGAAAVRRRVTRIR